MSAPTLISEVAPVFKRYPRLKTGIEIGLAAHTIYGIASGYWDQYKDRRDEKVKTFTIILEEEDSLYQPVLRALLDLRPPEDHRVITVGWSGRNTPLSMWPAESAEYPVRIGEHDILVVTKERGFQDNESAGTARMVDASVQFRSTSIEGRDAVISWIQDISSKMYETVREPQFRVLSATGNWRYANGVSPRQLDSVILPEGQKERLITDIDQFLDDRARYDEIGIPWHRGYVFHGPPGGGKTSLAKGLANHFELDLWYAPLSVVKSDSELLSLITEIGNGMLVLEDIDVFSETHARSNDPDIDSDDDGPVTLAGLLNSLDGIFTPPGLITVMTTNNFDVLDPALIRPGRIDVIEEVGYCTDDQATKLLRRFYGDATLPDVRVPEAFSPADLIEVIKNNWDTPDVVVDHLNQLANPLIRK